MDIIETPGRKIFSWAGTSVEDKAIQQAAALAQLPFVINHVALMPDAHAGYGMPIGGVLFADKAVVPYAIGVDIGCGVVLIETDMTVEQVTPESLESFLRMIARDVPVGPGPKGTRKRADGEPFPMEAYTLSQVAASAIIDADLQLGTLGGGNHFLELQADDEGRVWFMLHSGSRSVGKKICDHHHKVALDLNKRWFSALPDEELAYLPWGTDEAKAYWNDMNAALAWAEENRRRMAGKVIAAFGMTWAAQAWQVLDVHHNYAAWENHMGRNGIVHRKGAVRAQQGEKVLIPGSMSTGSYAGVGLGNPRSFASCQHGAGRARSRAATRKMTTLAEMDAALVAAGVVLVTPDRESVLDESGLAYKDIEGVMAASADLVQPTMHLRPLGVVKG